MKPNKGLEFNPTPYTSHPPPEKRVKESENVSGSIVPGSATSWTIARKAPLYIKCSRREYWSGLSFPSSRDIPDSGMETVSLELQAGSLPLSHHGSQGKERSPKLSSVTNRQQFS